MPVHSKIQICTFTFSDNPLLTQQDDSQGQYVCAPKVWLELLQFFFLSFLFFSLNPCISKTVRGTGLK